MDANLQKLIHRAGISTSAYSRDLWFRDCVLVANILQVPKPYQAAMIERCFLEDLRKVMADVSVRVVQVVPVHRDTPSAFKKGYVPPVQGDFLP